MNEVKMMINFCEIAEKLIPGIDENGLEYDFRHNEVSFDKQGPICSDSILMTIFRNNISEHIDDNELYKLIEQICLTYTNKCNSKK